MQSKLSFTGHVGRGTGLLKRSTQDNHIVSMKRPHRAGPTLPLELLERVKEEGDHLLSYIFCDANIATLRQNFV